MLRLTSSALALIAMTAPAFADLTPEQVWQSWVDYYTKVGYTVTEGSRDKAGDTLTLRDVQIASGTEGSTTTLKLPQVVLAGSGDGKVNTTLSEELSLTLEGTEPEGDSFTVPLVIKIPGNATVTSGAPEDMTHELTYPTIDLVATTKTVNGTETPLPMRFGLTNSAGKLHIVSGASAKYDYDMTSEAMSFDGDVSDDQGGQVKFSGGISKLESKGSMITPGGDFDIDADMDAALKAGLAMDGNFTAGALNATFDYAGQDEEGQPSSGNGKYEGQGFDAGFRLSQEGLGYRIGSEAMRFDLTSPQMPFPIGYAVESAGMDLQLPVSQRDEAQPFRFAYTLKDVTMAEEIWKIFDPQSSLPRDPASLELDLSGLMKVTANLFDMPETAPTDDAEADMMTDEVATQPTGFEPVELRIDKLALELLGASASATGQLKTVEGGSFDAPVGQIHAEYQGINTLLDTLGSIGLIPQEQMMGVRMMLAMVAKPVEGSPDKMTTDVEFKEGGSVFANGQQIR